MAECLFTDGLDAAPLLPRHFHQHTAVCLYPSQPAVPDFAHQVNGQQQHEETAKQNAENQIRCDQLLEEIHLQGDQCDSSPPNPLWHTLNAHSNTYPRPIRCKPVTERTALEVSRDLPLNKTAQGQRVGLRQEGSQNVTHFAEYRCGTYIGGELQLASFFELAHQAAAHQPGQSLDEEVS